MIDADRPIFHNVMVALAEMYDKELSKEQLSLWWMCFDDWGVVEFQAAARHLMRTCEFMPKPADFARLRRPVVSEAFSEVMEIVRSSAYRRGVRAGGLADRAVTLLGGYERLGRGPESELQWLEKRFKEVYEELSDAEELPKELAGPVALRLPDLRVNKG